jgi:hypothetical protein
VPLVNRDGIVSFLAVMGVGILVSHVRRHWTPRLCILLVLDGHSVRIITGRRLLHRALSVFPRS